MTAAFAPAASPQPFEVPEGGLASFLTATEGDWADDAPEYDIVRPMADKLASYGREGDTRLAHVAEGETVIPMEVLENDPQLKDYLFARMREMDLEPERYIVGNELNSINPVTGQPEFFLKKLFKGVKKAVKGVVKVFKQFAPLIIGVGLNMLFPTLGTIAAGALGGGIGTLVQGGSMKDAFKNALIGGAIGGITSGIQGVASGEGFMAGVKGGLPGAAPAGAPAPIETGKPVFDAASETTQALADAGAGAGAATDVLAPINVTAQRIPVPSATAAAAPAATAQSEFVMPTAQEAAAQAQAAAAPAAPAAPAAAQAGTGLSQAAIENQIAANLDQRGFLQSMKDFISSGDIADLKQAFLPESITAEKVQSFMLSKGKELSLSKAAEVAAQLNPSSYRAYFPLAGLGFGAMYLSGGLEPQETAPVLPYGGVTGYDLLQQNPERYGLAAPGSSYQPIQMAANGGDISSFPRRNGHINGPGTETSDDIPAMLSDGEFVMTARAVRGAGDGSREEGIRRMYDMMRTFERRAARG